jgi:dienelactone hydrolase
VQTREVEYEAEGLQLMGRLAIPDGDDVRPGVVIAHEGPGLDDFQRERANRMAELGYVAFALDYHGGGTLVASREDMNSRLDALSDDLDRMRAIGRAGLDVLRNERRTDRSKLAALGYCFGGSMALELARGGEDLKAVVGFHPGMTTTRPEDARNIVGRVLMCVGTDDPYITLEDRLAFEDEMRAGGVDWQMILYGGVGHSFTHPLAQSQLPGLQYDARADADSWQAMVALLEHVFAA